MNNEMSQWHINRFGVLCKTERVHRLSDLHVHQAIGLNIGGFRVIRIVERWGYRAFATASE